MANCDRFSIRDGWLRKLHHRWQVAHDGSIQRDPVGIFSKRCRLARRRARQIQIRRSGPDQNRNAIRNNSLSAENLRRPDDAARARRLQARVHEDKRNAPLIFESGNFVGVVRIRSFRGGAFCCFPRSSYVLLSCLQRLHSFVDHPPRILDRLLVCDEAPARDRVLFRP